MKTVIFSIIVLLFFKPYEAPSQPIVDTGTLRTYINTYIGANGQRNITGTQMNVTLNGVLNVLDDMSDNPPALIITTSGTSGPSTLTGDTLNIPQYSGTGSTLFGLTGSHTASGNVTGNLNGNTLTISNAKIGINTTPTTDDLTIGGTTGLTGNVGIGIASQSQKLFVNGSTRLDGTVYMDGAVTIITTASGAATDSVLTIGASGIVHMRDASVFGVNDISTFAYHSLTDGATVSVNYTTGINFTLTIGGNRNITFSNTITGKCIYITITQDGTGNHTLTFPANTIMPLGIHTGTTLNLSTAAGAVDDIYVKYDGTNYHVGMSKNMDN